MFNKAYKFRIYPNKNC
ncbi:helix-turn-helix domain-containing protein [Bacillus cereus]